MTRTEKTDGLLVVDIVPKDRDISTVYLVFARVRRQGSRMGCMGTDEPKG